MQTRRLDVILESFGEERRMKYSLDRMHQALAHFGNPERAAHTLVIGGTNGKGSTSLLLSAALTQAGYRTGTFLSPHLQSPHERFLNGLEVASDEVLAEVAAEVLPVAQRFGLSYFEFLTVICLLWSKALSHEFLVLEVGLGGRLDATNVTDPLACAISSIGHDHQSFLGETLPEILREKMGIFRPEGLVFSGITDRGLKTQLEDECNRIDAIYYHADELRTVIQHTDWSGQSITLNGYPFVLTNPSAAAAANAGLAFLLLRIVFPRISMDVLRNAFARTNTPGRMEVVSEQPRVVLSGDHNPQGIQSLCDSLVKLSRGKVHVVCGFAPDKPAEKMLGLLRPAADSITLTTIPRFHETPPDPKAIEASDCFIPDPWDAVQSAIARIESSQDTVLITGSLYLVGELRKHWRPDVQFWRPDLPAFVPGSVRSGGVATPATLRAAVPEQTSVLRFHDGAE